MIYYSFENLRTYTHKCASSSLMTPQKTWHLRGHDTSGEMTHQNTDSKLRVNCPVKSNSDNLTHMRHFIVSKLQWYDKHILFVIYCESFFFGKICILSLSTVKCALTYLNYVSSWNSRWQRIFILCELY